VIVDQRYLRLGPLLEFEFEELSPLGLNQVKFLRWFHQSFEGDDNFHGARTPERECLRSSS
jgi:hypothetical protein